MNIQIENDFLCVKAQSLSAELTSLYSKTLQREFLWQPGKEIFPNQAKNLFPNVGMINRERVFINGKEYPAVQHGFTKDTDFAVAEHSGDRIVFRLSSGELTKKYLPYDFDFDVIFQLDGPRLRQTYRVENRGENDMYFAVGAHTGFYCPIALDEASEDYVLQFADQSRLTEIMRNPVNSLRNGKEKEWLLDNSEIPLSDCFFHDGAKIFTNFTNSFVRLLSKKSGLYINIEFEGFPYCTFWSRAGELYYICIEPWCGLPDSEICDHVFERKEGNIKLPKGRVFERTQIMCPGQEETINGRNNQIS